MQISRSIPLACAAIVFLAPVLLNAQTAPGKAPGAPPPRDPALIEKAREALRQRVADIESGQPSAPSAPAQPEVRPEPAPEAPVTVVPPPTRPSAVEPYTLTPSDADAAKSAKQIIAEEEKARVAAEKEQHRQAAEAEKARAATEKWNRRQAAQAEKERADAEKIAAREAAKVKSSPTLATSTPMPAPAPFTAQPVVMQGSREQRLQQLLNDYKADKISPQEFHQRRAKILAE